MRVLPGVLSVLCILGVPAWASPSGVEITGFQVRGPAGGNDEYVEIRNLGASNVDISGWQLQGCASGSPGGTNSLNCRLFKPPPARVSLPHFFARPMRGPSR